MKKPPITLKLLMALIPYSLVYASTLVLTIILSKISFLTPVYKLFVLVSFCGGIALIVLSLISTISLKKKKIKIQSIFSTYQLRKYLTKTVENQVLVTTSKSTEVGVNEQKIKTFNSWARCSYIELTDNKAMIYLRQPWSAEIEEMVPNLLLLKKRIASWLPEYYFSDFSETYSKYYIVLEGTKKS